MSTGCTHYQSYLLRLWRDDAGELLHASLQSTTNGSIFHLKDMDELLTFLSQQQTAKVSRAGAEKAEGAEAQP